MIRPGDDVKVVASGVDTLYLSFDGALAPTWKRKLQRYHRLLAAEGPRAKAGENVDGSEFAVGVHGAVGVRFVNGDLTLLVRLAKNDHLPVIRAQLRSAFLWEQGWSRAGRLTTDLVGALLTGVPLPVVSRVDLTVDFQGTTFRPDDLDGFVGRAKHRSLHHVGPVFTGFSIGRSAISSRLYDKTVEIVEKGKEWFVALWSQRAFNPEQAVWRLEFQLRGRSLRELGVRTLNDLRDSAPRLWSYLTRGWLRLAQPSPEPRRSRWKTDPRWEALAVNGFGDAGGQAVRERRRSADIDRMTRGMIGYIRSFAALQEHTCLDETVADIRRVVIEQLGKLSMTFDSFVASRRWEIQGVKPVQKPSKYA